MKIALFTDSFLPSVGGTEQAVLRFATELSKEHQVMVFAPRAGKNFDDSAFPFKVVRAKSIRVTKNDYWAMPWLSGELKKQLNKFQPDVVHTQTVGMMAGFGNKYAKKHNVPVVCTVHTKFRYCYKDALKNSLLAEILLNTVMKRVKKSDRVCAVSQSMANELKSYRVKNPITVIRNGNDLQRVVTNKDVKTGKFKIIFVGRIIDYKNLGFSLEVLGELKKTYNDFEFYLVGQGPHVNKFKKLSEKLGIKDNVIFTGVITDKAKLKELYAQSDLFFFTSLFDSDGLVVMEAASEGTPSLVLNESGVAERMVDNQTGFIVGNDKTAIVKRLKELIEDRELLRNVGLNSYKIFSSWKETVEKYLVVYKEEIGKKLKNKKQ